MKFTVQPEVTVNGVSRTVGYNYPMYGGDSTYSILPAEVMETNSLRDRRSRSLATVRQEEQLTVL